MTNLPTSTTGKSAVEVARACAEAAGAIMREAFGHTGVSATKGRGNVLTEADLAVEQAVMDAIAREYPDHAVLSEETAAETHSDGWMWVVDPIDGTKNFSRGIPHFAFNLALCTNEIPVLALTLQPLTGEEWLSVAGEGCQLNGTPVRVSGCERVRDAVFAMDLGYDDAMAKLQIATVLGLWPGMQSLRVSGSAALGFAWAAAGRVDLYLQPNLFPWDIAPGLLHVREAGGLVLARDGGEATIRSQAVVAAPAPVAADFLALAADFPWQA